MNHSTKSASTLRFLQLFFAVIIFSSIACYAQEEEVARLDSADGIVEALIGQEKDYKTVQIGTIFRANDTIRTTKNSRAAVLFKSGTILRLAPGTTLQFQALSPDSNTRKLNMASGLAHFFDREPGEFPEIDTPAVTTAVRGTEFVIKVSAERTEVSVLNGIVECRNSFGSALAQSNESINTHLGEAPIKGILVNPLDAVQWTLYYPELLGSPLAINSKGQKELVLAQKLLSSGQVTEAESELAKIDQIIKNSPASLERDKLESVYLSQKSIIATVRNKKDEAYTLGSKSWELNNNASSALATAYALQSAARLDEAKTWLEQAAKLDPDSTLVLARQAELALGFGDIEEAQQLVEKALQIAPDNSYALSIMGFVNLILDKREEAYENLSTASKIAPGSGLTHLGLGLTLIKKGQLEQGRKEIEMAVLLEPNVAIYRSYLGKAFFEEDREDLAIKEYDHAIAIDDKDPTPYLYRAFSNLSGNKPVAALADVEKSIELNNNRAVYRSSLLLDQDLGVRSAGLAEVFNNLGFSQAARIEAIKSINKDYNNYSAHRLLSGSYNTIFLNDAGLSENKLATLLAPLSFNLYNQGSAVSSFNEYNSLFDRDQNEVEVAGQIESQDNLFLPEVRASGKKNEFGYLLSYDGAFTDEPGAGNDSHRNTGRAAIQYQPDYNDLFLIDSTTLYRKSGNDREAPDDINFDDYQLDFGYRHSFGPNSNLIIESSLSDQHSHYISHNAERDIGLVQQFQGEIAQLEDLLLINDSSLETIRSIRNSAQWVYDSQTASLVMGTQVYTANANRDEDSAVIGDQEEVFTDLDYALDSFGFNQLNSVDLYTYSTWHLAPWIDANAGATYSQVELEEREITPFIEDTYSKHHLSPKAGLTVYPSDQLTLRGAFFETLRKSSLEDQISLEPTLVGGLNQRFTDLSGAFSRTFGLGADYKAAASTYLGIEGFRRHVVEDLRPALSTVALDYDTATASNDVLLLDSAQIHSNQNILSAYINQVFSERLVGTISSEWYKTENTDPELAQDLDLNKVAFGLRYFDPSGWYLASIVTGRHQQREGSSFIDDGSDTFWLADAAMGYRLEDQKGAIELRFNNIFATDFSYDQSQGYEDFVRDDFNAIVVFTFRN